MTARTPVYIESGKLHVFESGDTLPPWLSPSSMAWENLTGVPAGLSELAVLTGPGYAKVDAAGAWSVQAAIPQADVSGLTTTLAGLQPISARLTAIAGLTDAAGWLHDDGSGNWALTTPTKSDVGLGSVENTALSTWAGSANVTTLGTVASGTWHGTAIADAYIASAATWNAKEGSLGNPSISGQVLASTTAGVRSWVSLPAASTTTPAALGTAAVGTGTTWARADHVHAMPTASQVGAEPALGSPSVSGCLLSSTSAGVRSWVAPYSLPTATASVLGGVKVGTGLSISSGALSVSYGNAAGTACVGNDSRLSDSRTPTAHVLDGALHTISGKTAGQALLATGATTFGFVTVSGDATLSGTGALTLASLLTAGSAGSSTSVPALTWDTKGRLTAVGSAAISIPHTQISDWSTYINQALLTTSSPTFANATIHGAQYTVNAGAPNFAAIYGSATDIGHLAYTWALDGSHNYINAANTVHLDIGGVDLIALTSTAFTVTPASTFTGLITANGGITGNLTGTASNASALGGVNSDFFVQGTGLDANSTFGRRTTSFNYNGGAPTATSLTDPLKSGFYDGAFTSGQTPNSNWAFVINTAHSNQQSNNKFQFQIAAGFGNKHDTADWGAENYWMRVINNRGVGDWHTLMHSDNYPSFNNFTSGLTTTTLTASGLITANGGITGSLTGHASLDIPLTGSTAITGELTSSNASTLGSASSNWGAAYATSVGSTGTTSISSFKLSGDTLTLSHADGNFIWENTIRGSAGGLVLQNAIISGTFSPAVNSPGAPYTIRASDQGKMVMTIQQLSLPALGIPAGFWCIINWHSGGGGVKFGPSTSGTVWYLRGSSTTVGTLLPVSGIASWDGYTWYVN